RSGVGPADHAEAASGHCLDARVHQIVPVDEILVVDNNSTDRTAEIAEKYRDHGVRVIRETVQGLIPARNRGFDEATGDILGRIDADTVVEPDRSQRLAEAFADPDVAAATGPPWCHDAPLRRPGLAAQRQLRHRGDRV